MKNFLLLLIFIVFTFSSCRMDVEPDVTINNDIMLSVDGENMDGVVGEWTITSEEKEEGSKDIIVITITKKTKTNNYMKSDNTKAQMRKGILELCILSILKKDPKYSSEILITLKESKLIVVEGTIYPLLTRLKNTNLLEYKWKESSNGPPRKYYNITDEGKVFLKDINDSWLELSSAVTKIRNK